MSLLVKITLSAALILSIAVPFGAFAAGEKTKGRYKTALAANVFLFFGTMVFAAVVMFSGNAAAAETGAQAAGSSAAGMGYLSAALATGLSCLGGGIAVSAAGAAFCSAAWRKVLILLVRVASSSLKAFSKPARPSASSST